jgi:molecular chaperone GrpE (heat shock protein)
MTNSNHETLRRRMLERFEAWLDLALAGEDPPRGIPPEFLEETVDASGRAHPQDGEWKGDLFSLYARLTSLVQETKLQGRAFERLHTELESLRSEGGPLSTRWEACKQEIQEARAEAREALALREDRDERLVSEARNRVVEETLDLLLDLRERLVRGVDAAQHHLEEAAQGIQPGAPPPRFGKRAWARRVRLLEATRALRDGSLLGIKRLEEVLERYGVSEIPCKGLPFDPRTMMAVDIRETGEVPDGTVLEVFHPGYMRHDRLYRTARVQIVRAPNPPDGT